MKTQPKNNKVSVITLGCSKNLVDSENLITQLQANDYDVEHDNHSDDSNVLIINTCGFIERAKQESVDTILEGIALKKEGHIEKLYVTGCLSERYREDLEKEMPEVDAYFGTMELPGLLNKLKADYKHELIGERWTATPQHYAYMKISEGCNRTCSFCAIPLMRGKHISRPIEALVKEAKNLARNGVKEIMLIAQELTYYGLDIYKERALPKLLRELCKVEGIEWIRLHYAYPSKFPIEIIEVMKEEEKVCNYLDIPLQHAADPVLKSMRRHITKAEQIELINKIKSINPNIAIRTTMLVGFPGETEDDFNVLCDYIRQMKFDRLGVFMYSHEEDTSAHQLKDDVPAEVKAERSNKLMEIQQEISFEKNVAKIGNTYRVLFDRKEGEYFIGRTEYDSPEVDNEVMVHANDNFVRIGDYAQVEIINSEAYDLYGKVIS
ncbi:MAG: 30S ribosomal protein S12 methylthiotransferase RimO [Bacteroidia bacterium]|nr:30S ribosomal protein S12 methylthiotransferase RimO [Bacteroidia bacterium]